MGTGNESLILQERADIESAPFLFADEDLPQIDKTKPKFHCTGERLWRDRPDVYKAVVKLLAEPGVTIRTICRECHITDDLVRSVKARENIPIAHEKRGVLQSISHGLRLASERVIEVMPTASAKDALLGVGILTDKMQLLAGEPTARVEEVQRIDIFGDWDSFLAQNLEPEKVREIGSVARNLSLNSADDSDAPSLGASGNEAVERAESPIAVSGREECIHDPGEAAVPEEVHP